MQDQVKLFTLSQFIYNIIYKTAKITKIVTEKAT